MKLQVTIELEVEDEAYTRPHSSDVQDWTEVFEDLFIRNGQMWNLHRATKTIVQMESPEMTAETRSTLNGLVGVYEAREQLYTTCTIHKIEPV